MNVSVIVCSYNRREALCEVVKSILNADWIGMQKEVIVVLDHCFDGSRRELEYRYGTKSIKLLSLDGDRRGQPAAFNYGIENSKFENVFLADDDRIFEHGYFQKICPYIKPGQLSSGNSKLIGSPNNGPEMVGYVNVITGFYGLYKGDCYDVGGFDENMGTTWGFVDVDFARRLDMLGVKFRFDPDAITKDLLVPYNINPKTDSEKHKQGTLNEAYLDYKYSYLWDDIFLCPLEETGKEEYPNRSWFEIPKYKSYRFLK